MKNFFRNLFSDESGQGMVEYGLIIALVAVVAITLLSTLGGKIKGVFSSANDALTSAGIQDAA